MLTGMGMPPPSPQDLPWPDESERRELAFVLPPLERPPLADHDEKVRAVLRVIAQAERERADD
jgi:hypothetical protein